MENNTKAANYDIFLNQLEPNTTLRGSIFPEPVQVIIAIPMGGSIKLIGKGLRTGQVYEPILSADQIAGLKISPVDAPYDGNANHFRLGIEALRLRLAYEYDLYFSLSIARIDPLPHQLEAVYDYFLKLPRIRFLLADDPGAGKTIMAGLLIKELKVRGLVKRVLDYGRGNVLHRRLFIMETLVTATGEPAGSLALRQPTLFLDISPAPAGTTLPDTLLRAAENLPDPYQVEQALVQQALHGFLDEITQERQRQVEVVSRYMENSLNALIDRVQCQYAELEQERMSGSTKSGLEGRMKIMEDHLDELKDRLESRRAELQQEGKCTISDLQRLGQAWVLPHPERQSPSIAPYAA